MNISNITTNILTSCSELDELINISCNNDDDYLTPDFYVWYLSYDELFFINNGTFTIDSFNNGIKTLVVEFDFRNIDKTLFSIYNYKTGDKLADWSFERHKNWDILDIKNIKNNDKLKLDINVYSDTCLKYYNSTPIAIQLKNKDELKKLKDNYDKNNKNGFRKKSYDQFKYDTIKEMSTVAFIKDCKYITMAIYTFLYNSSKIEPDEVITDFKKNTLPNKEFTKYKYKYDGYIDLSKTKIYKPIIDKKSNVETKEYQRHIDSWIVRGHYRKTKNGKIWIKPFIKGQGNLEKRTYYLSDNNLLDVDEKIFMVETISKIEKSENVDRCMNDINDIEIFINQMLKGTKATQGEKDAIVLKWGVEREAKDDEIRRLKAEIKSLKN